MTNVLAGLSMAPLASVIGYNRTFLTIWLADAFTLLLVVMAARKLAGLYADTEPSKQPF